MESVSLEVEQEIDSEVASSTEPSNIQGSHESQVQVASRKTAQEVNSVEFSAVKSSLESGVEQDKYAEETKERNSVQSGSQIENGMEIDFGNIIPNNSNVKSTDAEYEVLSNMLASSVHRSKEPANTSDLADKKVNMEVAETKDPGLPPPDESADANLVNTATGDLHDITSQMPLPEVTQSLYHIKWFKWKGLTTALIMQNENGPCPLLAVINLLILSRKISIPPVQEFITAGQLMEYLGDCILEHAPKKLSEGAQLNYEQNMHDAIGIMCKLQTGLDVNVKFTGVADFEFTPESIVFDLLNIGLYHGWLVDPQDSEQATAVGKLSYNQLVEKIIATKQKGDDSQMVSEGLIAESFLERTASQLTYHGLCELNAHLKDEELCVFFRNNHFSTLYKHKHELFLLVTDQGFLTEEQVIWETLSNVEGDCVFVDANFRTSPASRPTPPPPPPQPSASVAVEAMAGISQEDQDYLVALSLQEEQHQPSQTSRQDGSSVKTVTPDTGSATLPAEQANPQVYQEWTDLQLAMQLQEEEQRQQQQQARIVQRRQAGAQPHLHGATSGRPVQRTSQPTQENQHRSNGFQDKCTIL